MEKTTIVDKNGRSYAVRSINESDQPNLITLFEQMGEESRYRRFHQPVADIQQELIQAYADEIIAQTVEQGAGLILFDGENPIGVARLVQVADKVAEIAMSIADAYHNCGIGKRLLTELTQQAAKGGWRQLVATIQNDNTAIWQVLKSLPFLLIRQVEQGESDIRIHLTAPVDKVDATLSIFSNFPTDLAEMVEGDSWFTILLGHSESAVFRLEAVGKQTRYLKVVTAENTNALVNERDRLFWLNGRLPVPTVLAFHQTTHHTFLLMSAIDGSPASQLSNHPAERKIIHRLAEGLRQIHALPIEQVPFDQRLDAMLTEAKTRMEAGQVDEDDFDEVRQGKTAETLYADLIANRPEETDLVFAHGDYCLPNVLVDLEIVRGFIDWGRGGISDRYRDLALVARSLAYNFGPASVQPFFEAYGISEPDNKKLAYYQLLDEFF